MARKKKKRKYTKRANAPRQAATRKKKRKYTKRAEAAPKRKYTRRADKAAVLQLPELLRAGLEQVQTQIQERTEQLIQAAVGTDAPSVSAMLTEAAKQADSDPVTKNLLLIRSNIQNALSVLENLEDKPRRGRKNAKAEVAEAEESDDEETTEIDAEAEDDESSKKKGKSKVTDIKKAKAKPKKAASTLKKKSAEG